MFTADDVIATQHKRTALCALIRDYVNEHTMPGTDSIIVPVGTLAPAVGDPQWKRVAGVYAAPAQKFTSVTYDTPTRTITFRWTVAQPRRAIQPDHGCDFTDCKQAAVHVNERGPVRHFCEEHRCHICTSVHLARATKGGYWCPYVKRVRPAAIADDDESSDALTAEYVPDGEGPAKRLRKH